MENLSELVKLNFPDDWQNPVDQFFNSNLQVYDLSSKNPLWTMIEQQFQKTMQSPHKILKIEVVQNINLWRRFQVERG